MNAMALSTMSRAHPRQHGPCRVGRAAASVQQTAGVVPCRTGRSNARPRSSSLLRGPASPAGGDKPASPCIGLPLSRAQPPERERGLFAAHRTSGAMCSLAQQQRPAPVLSNKPRR